MHHSFNHVIYRDQTDQRFFSSFNLIQINKGFTSKPNTIVFTLQSQRLSFSEFYVFLSKYQPVRIKTLWDAAFHRIWLKGPSSMTLFLSTRSPNNSFTTPTRRPPSSPFLLFFSTGLFRFSCSFQTGHLPSKPDREVLLTHPNYKGCTSCRGPRKDVDMDSQYPTPGGSSTLYCRVREDERSR